MDILAELERIGAVFTDKHFIYTSGKHGSGYINMDIMFPHTSLVSEVCKELIRPFEGAFDTIAAPATGGIVLSVLSALASDTKGVWADKADGGFIFERAGFSEQIKGKRVLVVEDLLTTGGSVEKVCRAIEQEGGTVVGVSVVCNRGGVTAQDLRVPQLTSLASVNFSALDPDTCELCAQQEAVVEDMGHGDDFKKAHPDYAGGFIKLAS